jgi:hypothetical protein
MKAAGAGGGLLLVASDAVDLLGQVLQPNGLAAFVGASHGFSWCWVM